MKNEHPLPRIKPDLSVILYILLRLSTQHLPPMCGRTHDLKGIRFGEFSTMFGKFHGFQRCRVKKCLEIAANCLAHKLYSKKAIRF